MVDTATTELDELDGLLVLEPRDLYDPALLGYARRFNHTFAVYSEAKVLAAIVSSMDEPEDDEDPWDTAREHFEFNIVGAWVGDATPAFLTPLDYHGPAFRARVSGTPVPQGSKQVWYDKATGKIRMMEDAGKAHATWRMAVTGTVIEAMAQVGITEPMTGPVAVRLVFHMLRGVGMYGTGRNATKLKPSAPIHPAKPPDLDKLTRAVFDACTDARLWVDDAQVVALAARKQFIGRYSSDPPGVAITVTELPEEGPS